MRKEPQTSFVRVRYFEVLSTLYTILEGSWDLVSKVISRL